VIGASEEVAVEDAEQGCQVEPQVANLLAWGLVVDPSKLVIGAVEDVKQGGPVEPQVAILVLAHPDKPLTPRRYFPV